MNPEQELLNHLLSAPPEHLHPDVVNVLAQQNCFTLEGLEKVIRLASLPRMSSEFCLSLLKTVHGYLAAKHAGVLISGTSSLH